MVPSLLYHASNPPLYPTNVHGESLLAIRFPSVVRISSIRIIPEGVKVFSQQGLTYPASWTGQLLFNISSSNPVNALSATTISVTDSKHALDFPIDMPEGVTTRLMMLRSPATALTISIYGYSGTAVNSHHGTLQIEQKKSMRAEKEHEDLSWLWTWAGKDKADLVRLLAETESQHIRERALGCLDLLATTDERSVTLLILEKPQILQTLLPDLSNPFVQRLFEKPTFALHRLVQSHIPADHPLYSLANAATSEKHAQAWRSLHLDRGALIALQGCTELELLRVEHGEEKSNLLRLVAAAETYASGTDTRSLQALEMVLDLLEQPLENPIAMEVLADRLPRFTTIANAHRSTQREPRRLSVPLIHARRVMASLLAVSSEVVAGKLVYPFAAILAEPYLDQLAITDPLKTSFTSSSAPPIPVYPDDAVGRRMTRLADALSNPVPESSEATSSIQHAARASELLSLLAPALVESLSTAAVPPFSIAPNTAYASPDTQGASAWAGKVYSDHQFRTREGVAPNVAIGTVGTGGIGLGIAGMSASRPASRHVDEYA